jgi:hypothetical protein
MLYATTGENIFLERENLILNQSEFIFFGHKKAGLEINKITEVIIGCAIEVHKKLGPGLLESTYMACLVYKLVNAGLFVEKELGLPLIYKK